MGVGSETPVEAGASESGTNVLPKAADIEEIHAAIAGLALDSAAPPHQIATILDELDSSLRTGAIRRLTRREQKALYRKVEGFAPVGLSDLVPPQVENLQEVRHMGLNTLPAFRVFEKRFCRPEGEDLAEPTVLAGYNHQAMSKITGPGYFVAVADAEKPEVLVDYRRLPDAAPPDWPAIRSNERGLARFVYGFMVDRLRRVSEHVTVGSAARNGRDLGSYFVLNRAD